MFIYVQIGMYYIYICVYRFIQLHKRGYAASSGDDGFRLPE